MLYLPPHALSLIEAAPGDQHFCAHGHITKNRPTVRCVRDGFSRWDRRISSQTWGLDRGVRGLLFSADREEPNTKRPVIVGGRRRTPKAPQRPRSRRSKPRAPARGFLLSGTRSSRSQEPRPALRVGCP
jgi:hypothetical protein